MAPLWCHVAALCLVVEAYDIAQGLAWPWPSGSIITLAEHRQLIYQRITLKAGQQVSLEIAIPNYQCVTGLKGSAGHAAGRSTQSRSVGPDIFDELCFPGTDLVRLVL